MAFSEQLKRLLDFYSSFESDERVVALEKSFRTALKTRDQRKMEKALNVYVKAMSALLIDPAIPVISDDAFRTLSDRDQARFIREAMGSVVANGYRKTSEATRAVYTPVLRDQGIMVRATTPPMDKERSDAATALAIGLLLDPTKPTSTGADVVNRAFRQLIETGHKDTIALTFKRVYDETKTIVLASRVTTSSKPCDRCSAAAGIWFRADKQGSALYKYHDHCSCQLVTKTFTGKSPEEFASDGPEEQSDISTERIPDAQVSA